MANVLISWIQGISSRDIDSIIKENYCFSTRRNKKETSQSLKRKCLHFDEIFITGCTESCQNDNFRCSQWWKFHQNDVIFVSVIIKCCQFHCNKIKFSHNCSERCTVSESDWNSLNSNKILQIRYVFRHLGRNIKWNLNVHNTFNIRLLSRYLGIPSYKDQMVMRPSNLTFAPLKIYKFPFPSHWSGYWCWCWTITWRQAITSTMMTIYWHTSRNPISVLIKGIIRGIPTTFIK